MFLFTPLALGSYWTLPAFALVIPVIVFRLLNEEKVLGKDLPVTRNIACARGSASSLSLGGPRVGLF